MLIPFVLTFTISLPAPGPVLDASWGTLTRAPHLAGAWSIALPDGRTFAGDWVVLADADLDHHRYGYRHWIHLIDSTGGGQCSLGTEEPDRLYCSDATDAPVTDVRLATALVRDPDAMTADTALAPTTGDGDGGGAGRLIVDVRAAAAGLDDERRLFERITDGTLADYLAARGYTVVGSRATRTAITVDVEYATATTIAAAAAATAAAEATPVNGTYRYDRDVVRSRATIRIGRAPARVRIATRELERFVETCTAINYNGCCMPPPPTCERITSSAP